MTHTATMITKNIFVREGDNPLDFLEFYDRELKSRKPLIYINKISIEDWMLYTEDGDVYTFQNFFGSNTAQLRDFTKDFYIVESASLKEGTIQYKRPENHEMILKVQPIKRS